MGLFDWFRRSSGRLPKALRRGYPGIAEILEVSVTGMLVNDLFRVCEFRVRVEVPNNEPYEVEFKQGIPQFDIGFLRPGVRLPVRVNPDDAFDLAFDFESDSAAAAGGDGSSIVSTTGGEKFRVQESEDGAAEILATGSPAQAVVMDAKPLEGLRGRSGDPVWALSLTVTAPDGQPYQVQVGNPVPNEAIGMLVGGTEVPVKVGTERDRVVVDWKQALAQRDGP